MNLVFLLNLSIVSSAAISCTSTYLLLEVNTEITPVSCSTDTNESLVFYKPLPDGLYFENNTIVGIPVSPQQVKEYIVGPNIRADGIIIRIGILGPPTYFSYGFTLNILYSDVYIYPLMHRADTVFSRFMISPLLPNGLTLSSNGTISGKPTLVMQRKTYTVIAVNNYGSISTQFDLEVQDNQNIKLSGLLGCYYDDVSICSDISQSWFLLHDAPLCFRTPILNLDDEYASTHGSHAWSNLDDRFLDFYSASYVGYLVIATSGQYTFTIEVDDGAALYIDDMNTPLINLLKCSEVRTSSATTYLMAGKHLIYIPYFDINLYNILRVYYTSVISSNEKIYISEQNTRIGGHGPAFLSFPDVFGIVGAPIFNTAPSFNYGGAGQFTVDPPLPDGLLLDPYGVMTGTVHSPVSQQYVMTYTSPFGVTKTTFNIHISTTPLQGVYSTYYKYNDPNDMCIYEEKNAYQIEKRIERIDSTIYHLKGTYSNVWDGLFPDLDEHFYAEFQGYIYFNTIGRWHLSIDSDDGFKFYFNNELLFSDYVCHSSYRKAYGIEISKPGYYPFFIKYFENVGYHTILFEWKPPDSLQYKMVPDNALFYTPKKFFFYTSMESCFFVNKRITTLSPVWFIEGDNLSEYSISPSLPPGLNFIATTGTIQGVPETTLRKTKFTITNGNYQAIIYITILSVSPPRNFYYEYNGSPITDILTINATTSIALIPKYKNTITAYSITPSLPTGLSLDQTTGKIIGTIKQALYDDVLYTIHGCNVGGCATTAVILHNSGCYSDYPYSFYTKVLKGTASIEITGSNQRAANAVLTTSQQEYRHCFNYTGALTYSLQCHTESCSFVFYRDDKLYYFSQADVQQYTTTFSREISVPSFSLNNTHFVVHQYEYTELSIFAEHTPYSAIYFSPSLGSSLQYNYEYDRIEGFWTSLGKYIYSIQLENPLGRSLVKFITIEVVSCGSDQTLIQIEMQCAQYHDEESVVMVQSNQVLRVFEYTEDYQTLNYAFCVSYGNLQFELLDTNMNGWDALSYIAVFDENREQFGRWNMPAMEMAKHYIKVIQLEYIIKKESEWKFVANGVPSSWTSSEFDDTQWKTISKNRFCSMSDTSYFFRKRVVIDNPSNYSLLELSIFFKDGIILYINQQEVYRKNLSGETVDPSSLAEDSYSSYYYHRISVPSYHLVPGTNLIAIEIHKSGESLSLPFNFDCYGRLHTSQCVNRINSFTLSSSTHYNMRFETPYQALDNNTSTKWFENGLPSFITIKFDYDRTDWINKIQLYSGNDHEERDPKSFTLKGSNDDGQTWHMLLTVEGSSIWSKRYEMKEWWVTSTLQAYNMYRLDILNSESGTYTQISELQLFTCHLIYCLEDGNWPATESGSTAFIDCPAGYVGERTRMCSNVASKPMWLNEDWTNCYSLSPPSGIAYIDMILNIRGVTIEGLQHSGYLTIKDFLESLLSYGSKSVNIYLLRDVSTISQTICQCSIRVECEEKKASEYHSLILSCLPSMARYVINNNKDVFPDSTTIEFIKEPLLSFSTVLSPAIIALIVVLIILACISIFFIVSSLVSRRKRLRGKKRTLHLVIGHKRILKTI